MSSSRTVRVIVKAANGSIEDFRIDVGHKWRIKELKTHLYRLYPTHPPLTSQKLIYGGKLLLDQQTIEELAPEPKDNQVVIHLVAYERSASAPAMVSPTATSRQPSLAPVEETSREPSLTQVEETGQQLSAASLEETDAHADTATVTPPQTLSEPETQPAAVPVAANEPPTPNPWLRYRMTPYAQRFPAVPPVQNFPAFVPGNMPTYPFPQFYMSPYGAAYATQMAQWYYNYYGRLPPGGGGGGGGGGVEGNGEEGAGEILDLPNPQDLPNEQDVQQDVAVNAGGFGMMGGGNFQPMPRRDFVDYVYKFMMAGFLVTMAYITGSVGRLLIFVGGLLFMLLNQAGWFAVQRRRQANQPGEVEEPAPPNQQPPPRDREGEEEESEGDHQPPNNLDQDEGDSGDGNESADSGPQEQDSTHPPQPPAAPARPGLLATIFVFVTSFFTSLIPRQQPEPLMN